MKNKILNQDGTISEEKSGFRKFLEKLNYVFFKSYKLSSKKVALFTGLLIFAVFFIYPMIFVVINSFRPNQDIILNPGGLPSAQSFQKFGFSLFDNYIQAFKEMDFLKVFLNTLIVTVCGTVGIIFFSSMCAYGLVRS